MTKTPRGTRPSVSSSRSLRTLRSKSGLWHALSLPLLKTSGTLSMRYNYGEFSGENFQTPESLFPSPQVVRLILQYGQKALDAMDKLDSDTDQQSLEAMIEAGLLERDESTGELRLTPRMVRGIEHKSLLEIFEGLQRGNREGHQTIDPGRSIERVEGTKPYEFGDPISEIDLGATMHNALNRQLAEAREHQIEPKPQLPIHINAGDFEVHLSEGQSDTAVCILLDMSGSMIRYGRFYQAKRVALGMSSLIHSKFPQDTIDYVGFFTTASKISERELPLAMPKPISVHEYQVRARIPLTKAIQEPETVPQHFTNLQLGLRLARQVLSRRSAANKQLFVVTDGQPTAHVEPNASGEELLYLLYPPSDKTTMMTLQEALKCQQQGIRIATFALIEDYWGMDWVGFVDKMTRLTRGVAYYCTSEDLSSTVIESYLSGKKRKTFAH